MSAMLRGDDDAAGASDTRVLLPMGAAQLDAVMAIEAASYAFPWSRGNFVDSLAAGYAASALIGSGGAMLGYFVAMAGVDEMHLLNITIAPSFQGRGHARFLIDALIAHCQASGARELWLEVRASNLRARGIYERLGFRQVGVRKGYYPAPFGRREDAVVMSLKLTAAVAAAEAGDALE
jgi:[ribosomal protein S18]-alanine N-acetyltransferase